MAIITQTILDAAAVAARNLLIFEVPSGFKLHVLGLSFYDEDNVAVAQAYLTENSTNRVSWPFSREYQVDPTPLRYQSMVPCAFDVPQGWNLYVHIDCTALDNVHINITYQLLVDVKP